MPDLITVTGPVVTPPRHLITSADLAITSFRLAANHRRYDPSTRAWEDGETNWFTITAFRLLAENTAASIHKGDRVAVTGRLRVRSWENDGGGTGTTVQIDADTIGHDLNHGTTVYTRRLRPITDEVTPDQGAPVAAPAPAADANTALEQFQAGALAAAE